MKFRLFFLAVALCTIHATSARADTSSWLSAGGGYGVVHSEARDTYDSAGAARFAVGVGTNPTRSVVFGGLIRSTTYFTVGTELGLSLRLATGGFARGQWGLALDAGPGVRFFSPSQYGGFPVSGMIVLGAPWGLQLGVGADFLNIAGDPPSRGALAVLEIDLLRLTVNRQGATDRWWENPSPAGGRIPPAGPVIEK